MRDREINAAFSDASGKTFTFNSLLKFKEFVLQENAYWRKIQKEFSSRGDNLSTLAVAGGQLNGILQQLESLEATADSMDDYQFRLQINEYLNLFLNNRSWLWSGHSFTIMWIDLYREHGSVLADSFIEPFINVKNLSPLFGHILAYEFKLQDSSSIAQRRKAERISLSSIRDRYLNEQEKLFQGSNKKLEEIESWSESWQEKFSRQYNVRNKLGQRLIRKHQSQFEDQLEKWMTKIASLEATYQEKLRLEKPAEYWGKKAKGYFYQGATWISILGAVLLFGLIGGSWMFKAWAAGLHMRVDLNSIQGVIIFITILSIYAFSIRTLTKLAFSSFHLQRDAEEREQLTHVYLALTHERDNIDSDARRIVLQSLFSRADTGLLGGESSPTMPGLSELVREGAK